MSGSRGVCFDWVNHGACSRGFSCRFDHPASRKGQGQGRHGGGGAYGGGGGGGRSQGVCHEFQRTGNCRFGSSCKFRHVGFGSSAAGPGGPSSSAPPRRQQRAGQNVKKDASMAKFIKALAIAPRDRVGAELSKSSDLWRRCWQNHDLLDDKSKRMMLEVLARIPGSSSIDPPPIQFLEKVTTKFLQKEAAANASLDNILTTVKTVRDVLWTVLHMEWDCTQEQVVDGLSTIAAEADSKLRIQNKDHRETSKEIRTILDDLDKPWRIQLKETAEEFSDAIEQAEAVKYDDWKAPTVEWLCTPEFFSPSSCPKMKVGRSGVYESAEEYMDTSHKLWVAMTFFDGHAAMAPHCRSRGNNGTCGSALWPVADSQSQSVAMLKCRQPRCGRPAEFTCRIKGHDSLCRECATASIVNHRGEPGPKASTHIYDAQVSSVNSDGVVFLTGFKSRSPPPNTIHWRTTKRLAAPNLVGLVLLKSSGAALAEKDVIKWAEVVNHPGGNFRDEDRRRQNGQLAVNASSIVGWDPDYFERGCSVAIIDCMTFVPEWIPVLRALDSQRHTKLPFENGRHLNLIKDSPVEPANEMVSESITASGTALLIDDMIISSQLEPIREVRRDDGLKQQLASKLEQLVTSATLDKMQLVSFVEALRNPVHLTQGPPGTGKSYLGVVLVQALIIIRDLWMQKSRSRGASPILVLSYKNHAIDEFLVDLVKALPSLSRNQLIRIGGQCKDNRLAMFSERATYHSDPEVQAAKATVDGLKHLQESVQFTMDHNLSSFRSYYGQIFFGDGGNNDEDDAARQKAAQKALLEATLVLMECIIRLEMMQSLAGKLDDDDKPRSPAATLKELDFLLVDSAGKSTPSIQKQMRSPSGSTFIAALTAGAANAKKEHWGDHLEKWLTGKVPLPCCTYSEHCNDLAVSPQVPFCSNHLCYFTSRDHGRCTNGRRDDKSYFCSKHGCQADGCADHKFDEKQMYCRRHACWRCMELGLVAKLAEDAPPRNVCEDHPLCFYPGCTRTCHGDTTFCKDHLELKCQALTKKKKPCKGNAISALIPFCDNHRHLAHTLKTFPEEDTEIDEAPSFRPQEMPPCKALTRKGKQCKGDRMPGSEYCFDHAPPIGMNIMPTASNVGSSLERPPQELEKDTKPTVDDLKLGSTSSQSTTVIQIDNEGMQTNLGEDQRAETAEKADDCESGSDAGSFATANDAAANAADLEVDEMDIEEEEGENMQHLRDVFEVDSGGESDDDFSETSEGSPTNQEEIQQQEDFLLAAVSDPKEWSWELSLEQRWDAAQALMEKLRATLSSTSVDLKTSLSAARHGFQQAKTRAKAKVYENKKVIGGTMVGCISRLDSIRKTKPFAVVVEEASEVLEPLLFSCLSETTLKLEMIGDHRQLQPSVMSRYEFELCNKINISMFQRLIEAPSGHHISSTVLSIQRRMRKNICDLTRDFYGDVTIIEDHATCNSQKVGDRLSPKDRSIVSTSETGGREVPGIIPHVFLWTHNGIQERARVGISRINTHEARMCCALASYLVECGVPRPSIVCLTPYKGQLMELRNTIIKDARASRLKLLSRNPNEDDVIRLSTIDRFQGDEEDIVICSLVVDSNSKTGFVKLVNRMIVLLSRARLGLYILGNIGYFESNGVPKHWGTTFERLKLPAEHDSPGLAVDMPPGSRTGPELTICCPVHRGVTTHAATADKVKLGFCKEPCQHELRCGHVCSLDCHWPSMQHNSNCTIKLESPCQRHPTKVTCNQAFSCAKNAPASASYKDIMTFYQCPTEVSMTLPCSHVIKRPCHVEKKISDGSLSLPKCKKQSPTPYVFTSCGHELDVTCEQLEDYKADPQLVKCQRDELYESSCGHSVSMPCYRKSQILSGEEQFVCGERVPIYLPRCGHSRKVTCPDAQKIATWSGVACEEVGKVEEGKTYGPQDYLCQKQVTIHRKCGHQMKLPCNQAFARSTSLDACRESVLAQHPSCGHNLRLPCKQASDLAQQSVQIPDPVSGFVEGQLPSRNYVAGVPPCRESVQLQRNCGHIETLQCSEILKPRQGCRAEVSVLSPLCGHTISSLCHLNAELSQPFWAPDAFAEICQNHFISKETKPCRDASTFSPESVQAILSCKESTRIVLPCGHEKDIKCSEFLSWLNGTPGRTVKCYAIVAVDLPCGHKINVECHKREGAIARPCTDTKLMQCWNFAVCQNELEVPCGFMGIPACTGESLWICPAGQHSRKLRQCSLGVPEDCYQCSLDKLAAQRATPVPFVGQDSLRDLLRVPEDCIEWIDAPVDDFLSTESELLDRCLSYANRAVNKKEQYLLQAYRVPCFRSLAKKNQSMKQFEPKKCVNGAKSFHGIVTKLLTGHNLQLLAPKDREFTILVGYAAVVHTKVLKGLPPVKPGAKTALARSLVGDGYDSMSYCDKEGSQSLLVLDPFPMIGLCHLKLNREQLGILASQLDKLGAPDLEPRRVDFQPPTNGCTAFSTMKSPPLSTTEERTEDGKEDGDEDSDDDESTSEQLDQEAIAHLKGTEFEGLTLNVRWSGGFDMDIPTSVEKNLRMKMQFVTCDAPAFAGLQLIRTLLAEEDLQPLHLLMAAESVSHSSTEARESLNKYKQFVKSDSPTTQLHPWALIVAARLEESDVMQAKLLSSFHHFFPLYENFLQKDELGILNGLRTEESVAPDVHSILLQKWNELKAAYPGEVNSAATEELLNLTGLRKVKEEALRLWKTALQLKRMDEEARKENLMTANYCFLGNPGTGKTTVARLFAEMLHDAGIRANSTIKETTAQQVKDDGSDKFRKFVASAMGGALFIDEAYDLDPVGDSQGKPIVNELLTLCENDRDKISVILAGYEDDFQKKFFAYNDGLKSRFKEVMFEDFDETELATIWNAMRTKKQWNEEENVCSVAVRRIAKMSGKKGFGNAREVRKRLEQATQSAMARLGESFSQDTMVLTIEDVIGDDPRLSSEKLEKVLKEINGKVGWTRVKAKVEELIELCSLNYQRELLGQPQFTVFLNRMFLGSPGTGKTTCAKLYGRLLKELGFLSNGDVVSKTASDFVGQYIGQSQKQTNQILEQARGKVLIVDEAYALNDSMYGKQVLDTLVEKVQGTPSDDMAVLLLGYEEEMFKMLQEQNPGLTRRFPKEHAFYFDDYNDKELLEIIKLNLKAHDVEATLSFREKALDVLRVQRKRSNFGNAGSVELLVKGAALKAAKRMGGSTTSVKLEDLDIEDPGAARADKDEDPLSQLDKLYRMEKVKAKLEKMKKDWEVQRREGGEEPDLGHFVFLGAPGTGKTTVARAIAGILFSLGLLGSDKIVETTGLDLTGEYLGQTKTKVEDKLIESKGGVLFIDEAYNLGEGQFGKEACDTLVAAMTSEKFSDVLICIAGYPNDINRMLNANAGLKSRFTQFFQFLDWEEEDCVRYFNVLAEKEVFELEEGALEAVREGCGRIRQLKGWGNGRDLIKLWKETKSNRSERVHSKPELEKLIKKEDVRGALDSMIQARIGKLSNFPLDADPLAELDSLFRMESIKDKLQRLQKTWAVSKREGGGPPALGHFVFTGSPGTGKTTVARAIARVLFGLQLKPSDKLVETSALDLQAQYLGQTAAKVNDVLGEAKGACLFIDEAYNLSSSMGQFGKEACDALVAGMTSEDFKDVQIIIAGYPHEIDEMFKSNAGLKSRFTHFFEFPDWRPEDCEAFFQHCAKKDKFDEIDEKILQVVRNGFEKLVPLAGFANGRDVKAVWEEVKRHRAERVYDSKPEEITRMIRMEDAQGAMASMLQSRISKSPPAKHRATLQKGTSNPVAALDGPFRNRTPGKAAVQDRSRSEEKVEAAEDSATAEASDDQQQEDALLEEVGEEATNEEEVEEKESEEESDEADQKSVSTDGGSDDDDDDNSGTRDDGVPDDVWEQLQASKAKEKLDEEEIATLQADLDAAARREQAARIAHEAELRRLQEEQERIEQERRKAEEEKRKQLEEERRRIEAELKRRREAEEKRRRQAELERKRKEEALRRIEEAKRKKEQVQKKLRKIGKCPMGFVWHQCGGGWRCGGGSHYVSDAQLNREFGYDA